MASRLNSVSRSMTALTLGAALGMGGFAATLAGCDEPPKQDSKDASKKKDDGKAQGAKPAPSDGKQKDAEKRDEPKLEPVTIAGKDFRLEPALDPDTRFKGLSGRTEIKDDGGMLFVFAHPQSLYFVMRDCPIPIDIIFLDATGRVTALHKMVPEEPRTDDEKKLDENGVNQRYESRLKRYPSKYDAQFVIELKGNTLDSLRIKEGDQVKLDTAGLKKKAT